MYFSCCNFLAGWSATDASYVSRVYYKTKFTCQTLSMPIKKIKLKINMHNSHWITTNINATTFVVIQLSGDYSKSGQISQM